MISIIMTLVEADIEKQEFSGEVFRGILQRPD